MTQSAPQNVTYLPLDDFDRILLLDTFGDYWQRYWFHYDGWSLKINGNTVGRNYPGNISIIRISIFYSLIFYLTTLFNLTKEKQLSEDLQDKLYYNLYNPKDGVAQTNTELPDFDDKVKSLNFRH